MKAETKDNAAKMEYLCVRVYEFPNQPMVSGRTHEFEFGSMRVTAKARMAKFISQIKNAET
jgi:hypothetical protein